MIDVNDEKRLKKQPIYYSYLLRLRWVDNADQPAWRISLEEPGNQTRMHFNSLAAMCAYLTKQIGLDKESNGE